MTSQHFSFPPPPPPPPQASQNYPAYPQLQQGFEGYAARPNKGGRGGRINGRGHNRAGLRGGFPGSLHSTPSRGGNQTRGSRHPGHQNAEHVGENQNYSEYPLPNYPAVQLPQVPPNLHQDYGRQPSNLSPSNFHPQHSRPRYPSHEEHAQQYLSGPQEFHPHGYDPPMNGMQINGQGRQRAEYQPHNSVNQSMPMSSAIHMGLGGHLQNHQSHPLPQPISSGTISFPIGSPNDHNFGFHQQNALSNFRPSGHHSVKNHTGHRGRGQKRGYSETFGGVRSQKPRPQAAPAVPSFGSALPLPVKPPAPQDLGKRSRKRKRNYNSLGLTPKTEEHESSEEEDDADEESRLAAAVAGPDLSSQRLQFAYKGRTSTLLSSSDIAAWIEERKKRFPTKLRVAEAAERRRQQDDLQKKVYQARREAQEKQRAEAKEKQRLMAEEQARPKKSKKIAEDAEGAVLKAKRKVEKLRKKLEKEEKRAAKAEAKASRTETKLHGEAETDMARKRKRSLSEDSSSARVADAITAQSEDNNRINANIPEVKVDPDKQTLQGKTTAPNNCDADPNNTLKESEKVNHIIPDPLTPTSQPPVSDDGHDTKLLNVSEKQNPDSASQSMSKPSCDPNVTLKPSLQPANQDSGSSITDSDSEISDTTSEDLTSSSGSSSSASDSDDDAPRQISSKRSGPERVAAPKREKPRQICRAFLRQGRCKRGDRCRYRHELPERGSRAARPNENKKTEGKVERVSLHQRLVNQEKEKENNEILKAIIQLGERGLLEPEIAKDTAES